MWGDEGRIHGGRTHWGERDQLAFCLRTESMVSASAIETRCSMPTSDADSGCWREERRGERGGEAGTRGEGVRRPFVVGSVTRTHWSKCTYALTCGSAR